jgi:Protein of unknown function (DUF1566)
MNRRLTFTLASFFAAVTMLFPERAAAQKAPYYALPSWDQTLPAKTRFTLVMTIEGFGPQAVLDLETGLVWQRTPVDALAFEWAQARNFCRTENTGGRMGWRLPTVEELSSLLDIAHASADSGLPEGHPFDLRDVVPVFWSASVDDLNTVNGYAVTFVGDLPNAIPGVRVFPKERPLRLWCVRGGHGAD